MGKRHSSSLGHFGIQYINRIWLKSLNARPNVAVTEGLTWLPQSQGPPNLFPNITLSMDNRIEAFLNWPIQIVVQQTCFVLAISARVCRPNIAPYTSRRTRLALVCMVSQCLLSSRLKKKNRLWGCQHELVTMRGIRGHVMGMARQLQRSLFGELWK